MKQKRLPFPLFILFCFIIYLAGCTSTESATKALLDSGYSNVEITGHRIFGCSDDDLYHTGFKAVGPTGRPVTGVVCAGLLKNSTIRID